MDVPIVQKRTLKYLGVETLFTSHTPEVLSCWLPEIVFKRDLPRLTFHQLRRSCTTHLLVNGALMKVGPERFGHSGNGITRD